MLSLIYTAFIQVIRHFDGCKADLVVCDGAPDGMQYYFIPAFGVCNLLWKEKQKNRETRMLTYFHRNI